ncbi:MAG: hypothetical protein QXP34_00280 [Candidatus Aenigmatarchaeota archaeon]
MKVSKLEKIKEAIEKYNRYRSPEATAKIVEINQLGDKIEADIKFEGIFCETCGVNEYIYDLEYILKDFGLNAKVKEINEPEINEDYRIARFIVE